MYKDLVLLSGNANLNLAGKIAESVDSPLGDLLVSRFSDGETRVELGCNVRGRDVFIIQPTCQPTDHNIMEALIISDACRRASADRITLVAPYYGYSRQECKQKPRTPITAKLVADLIHASGIDRVVSMELHAGAIQGFFNIPFDHLFAKRIFAEHLQDQNIDIIVSPDAGGAPRARALAKELDAGLAIIDKRRDRPNSSEVMHVLGDVEGKKCLIYDDMCDTGGSLCKAADAILAKGATSVTAAVTHAVMSGPAYERIQASQLTELLVTDTIPVEPKFADGRILTGPSKIRELTVATIIAKAIKRIHNNESVSSLF